MSYAVDNNAVATWRPEDGPLPVEVATHTGMIRAHNAAFERLIFHCVLEQDFNPAQFYCTAAQARANCAPGVSGSTTSTRIFGSSFFSQSSSEPASAFAQGTSGGLRPPLAN